MQPIVIPFVPSNLGRVEFSAQVMTGNRKTFGEVEFKLDSGSDFTTISCEDLEVLGYERDFLGSCPHHNTHASTASEDLILPLQYISDVSIKFDNRELQGCRVFFALGTKLRSLFGSDILKYFNREINYDTGELTLLDLKNKPMLSPGEKPIHIYFVE
jgi:predicted aspartyl protease